MSKRKTVGAARPSVLLIGEGPTSLTALRSLNESCNVQGVLRSLADPDMVADPVRTFAAEHGIAVWTPDNLLELPLYITKLKPEAVVIADCRKVRPRDSSCSHYRTAGYNRLQRPHYGRRRDHE